MQQLSSSHTKGTKNGESQLRRALERLASESLQDGADAPARDFAEFIEAIAREVEETVLTRTFALVEGDKGRGNLTISNRRLVAVEPAGAPGTKPDSDETKSGDATETFVLRLRGIWQGSGSLRLERTGRGEGFSVTELSCAARDLRAVAASTDERRLKAFLGAIQPHVAAWTCRDSIEAEPIGDGPGELRKVLRALEGELSEQAAGQDASLRRSANRPTCTILPFSEGRQVFIAEEGEGYVLAVVEAVHVTDVMGAWNASFRA